MESAHCLHYEKKKRPSEINEKNQQTKARIDGQRTTKYIGIVDRYIPKNGSRMNKQSHLYGKPVNSLSNKNYLFARLIDTSPEYGIWKDS